MSSSVWVTWMRSSSQMDCSTCLRTSDNLPVSRLFATQGFATKISQFWLIPSGMYRYKYRLMRQIRAAKDLKHLIYRSVDAHTLYILHGDYKRALLTVLAVSTLDPSVKDPESVSGLLDGEYGSSSCEVSCPCWRGGSVTCSRDNLRDETRKESLGKLPPVSRRPLLWPLYSGYITSIANASSTVTKQRVESHFDLELRAAIMHGTSHSHFLIQLTPKNRRGSPRGFFGCLGLC